MESESSQAVKRSLAAFLLLAALAALVPATTSGRQEAATSEASSCWTPEQEQVQVDGSMSWTSPPATVIDPANTYAATLETNAGSIVIELFAAEAPVTVNNFVCLARSGFYDGTPVHRIVQGFVILAGDPTGTGRGGPGYQFVPEPTNSERDYVKGTVGMASAGPYTHGSQFFICTADPRCIMDKDYTTFGQVVSGMDVVDLLDKTPTEIKTNGEKSSPIDPVTLNLVTIAETQASSTTELDVDMVDIAFEPTEISVTAGTDVTLNLVNNGAASHNFTIEELGVPSGDYAAGKSGELTFHAPEQPAEYEFVCTVPGHTEAGMTGVLHVLAATPSTGTRTPPASLDERVSALETRVAVLETAVVSDGGNSP